MEKINSLIYQVLAKYGYPYKKEDGMCFYAIEFDRNITFWYDEKSNSLKTDYNNISLFIDNNIDDITFDIMDGLYNMLFDKVLFAIHEDYKDLECPLECPEAVINDLMEIRATKIYNYLLQIFNVNNEIYSPVRYNPLDDALYLSNCNDNIHFVKLNHIKTEDINIELLQNIIKNNFK